MVKPRSDFAERDVRSMSTLCSTPPAVLVIQLAVKYSASNVRTIIVVILWSLRYEKSPYVIADNVGPDQHGHSRRLIRAFIVLVQHQWTL